MTSNSASYNVLYTTALEVELKNLSDSFSFFNESFVRHIILLLSIEHFIAHQPD